MKSLIALMAGMCLALPALAAKPDLTSYEEVRFETHTDAVHGFTINYPYLWVARAPRSKQEVFGVSDRSLVPSLSVSVRARNSALPFDQSAAAAAGALGKDVRIISNREIDLNGTPAREAIAEWTLPIAGGVQLRTMMVSVYRGDEWIIIAGTDGQTVDGIFEDLKTAVYSARIGSPADKGDNQ